MHWAEFGYGNVVVYKSSADLVNVHVNSNSVTNDPDMYLKPSSIFLFAAIATG